MAARKPSDKAQRAGISAIIPESSYNYDAPLSFIVNSEGVRTAVVVPLETFNLMLDHMKALALRIERWDDESLSQEELDQLFKDYGVVRH